MNNTLIAALGISSGLFNTIGLVPYLRDIFRHKTKPERATWWIWLMLNIIAFSAQVAAGSTWSLFMTGAQVIAIGFIAILSVNYGYGKFQRKDLLSIVVAIIGIGLWALTKQPITALLIVICIDIVGFWLTITKTWSAPQTETLISWLFASISGILGILSVGVLNTPRLIYPIYITIGNFLMTWVIYYRRKSLTRRTINT